MRCDPYWFSSPDSRRRGTPYALLNLRPVLRVECIMKLRLVGTEPLVGVNLQHQFHGADRIPDVPCEICDGCGKPVLARNIYFDGERFLCTGCRQNRLVNAPMDDPAPVTT